MRFGKTRQRVQAKWNRLFDWHPFFAWYPVLLSDGRTYVWMERIERRLYETTGYGNWWHYRLTLP